MCVVCLALYGLRPRERTAPEGPPKRGRRSFCASSEAPGGVWDEGADDDRASKSASLGSRVGGRIAAGLLPARPKSV